MSAEAATIKQMLKDVVCFHEPELHVVSVDIKSSLSFTKHSVVSVNTN